MLDLLACSLLAVAGTVAAEGSAPPVRAPLVEGYILAADEGTKAFNHLVKIEPTRGATRLGLGTQRTPAGRGIPLHFHGGEDEVLYVLSGRGIGVVGSTVREVATGSLIYIPQGAWHGLSASEATEILWIVSPPGFASYLRESHDAAPRDDREARWAEIAAKHQYVDTDEFLKSMLAGSRWRIDGTDIEVHFAADGMRAAIRDVQGAGALAIVDAGPGGITFAADWTDPRAERAERVVLDYDFATGKTIEATWDGAARKATLRRAD